MKDVVQGIGAILLVMLLSALILLGLAASLGFRWGPSCL